MHIYIYTYKALVVVVVADGTRRVGPIINRGSTRTTTTTTTTTTNPRVARRMNTVRDAAQAALFMAFSGWSRICKWLYGFCVLRDSYDNLRYCSRIKRIVFFRILQFYRVRNIMRFLKYYVTFILFFITDILINCTQYSEEYYYI